MNYSKKIPHSVVTFGKAKYWVLGMVFMEENLPPNIKFWGSPGRDAQGETMYTCLNVETENTAQFVYPYSRFITIVGPCVIENVSLKDPILIANAPEITRPSEEE